MDVSRWWRRLWSAGSGSKRLASVPDRWVLVDVESSGLDARRDRLLAIAACAVHFEQAHADPRARARPHIVLTDSFEAVLRQDESKVQAVDKQNILIHGIGVGTQRTGVDPTAALSAWRDYVGHSPLVAYHSDFDQTMIDRACRQHLGEVIRNPWLDLEPLAAVLHQDPRRWPLDHWLDRYQIRCLTRHQAAADTLATAQLLLRLWPMVPELVRRAGFEGVRDHAAGHRFIAGRH
jgi:DNA polymerase-3 subunit epsilon